MKPYVINRTHEHEPQGMADTPAKLGGPGGDRIPTSSMAVALTQAPRRQRSRFNGVGESCGVVRIYTHGKVSDSQPPREFTGGSHYPTGEDRGGNRCGGRVVTRIRSLSSRLKKPTNMAHMAVTQSEREKLRRGPTSQVVHAGGGSMGCARVR